MSAEPAAIPTLNPAPHSGFTAGADLIAGLSIAGLLLPEAVAYSGIAGLPPQAGVIGLFVGLICYGVLGRSRYAIVSATSSSAAVLAAGTLAMAGPAGASRAAIAATLVLLTGACFLIAGAARLGGLSHLIARPVLRGFAFGLACVIALKQLPPLFGLPALHGDFVPLLLVTLLRHVDQLQPATMIAGVLALVLLFFCERWRRIPGSLLVIVLGIAASGWLAEHGVALTGNIQLEPDWTLPAWPSAGQWLPSVELAAALLLVLYAESYSSIRGFALKHGDAVSPNRDLLVLGVANAASGLLHGMPVGAGYSATSANEAAGAQSRLAGLIAATTMLLLVLLLLHWIERIPEPVLAAIVIHAVSKSWRLTVFTPYLVWKRDRLVALAAVLAVLALGILNGLLVAIAFSLIMLLRQLAASRLSVLGQLADSHDFVDITGHAQVRELTGILILRPEEPLFFANAETVLALARQRVEERQGLRRVILSLEESSDLDSTALEALADFAAWVVARRHRTLRRTPEGRRARTAAARQPATIAGAGVELLERRRRGACRINAGSSVNADWQTTAICTGDYARYVQLFLQTCIEHCSYQTLYSACLDFQIPETVFVHVVALRQFQLDRIDAFARIAVLPRDIAALETAVDDKGILALCVQYANQPLLQLRRTACTAYGAQIEIRQTAVEQKRYDAADRMAFPQCDATMHGLDPCDFVRECSVIRTPIAIDPCSNFGLRRFLPRQVNRLAGKLHRWTQSSCVLTGIQRCIVRRSVQIDHIPGKNRHDHGYAQVACEGIQARDVPVGIRHALRRRRHARSDLVRQCRAVVRQRYQERRGAAMQGIRFHCAQPFFAGVSAAIGTNNALGCCASWYRFTVTVCASLPVSSATTPPEL